MSTYGSQKVATETSLWEALEKRTRQPVPVEARRFLASLGTVACWRRASSASDRDSLLGAAVAVVRALRESNLLHGEALPIEPEQPAGRADGRWQLWRALRARATGEEDHRWSAFTVARVYDFTGTPALQSQRIEVSFDARLSLGSVVGTLRRLWPRMREAEWLRQTHPLGARKLALLEFVCLEMAPDSDWRTIQTLWNERYPQWAIRSVRGFQSEFRRAEASLTGEEFGLEWFYRLPARPESRGPLTFRQVMTMCGSGPRDEDRRFAARELAALHAGAREASMAFAPRVRWAQELAAAGLSVEEIADRLLEPLPEQLPVVLESGEEQDPRDTATAYVRALLELDLAQLPEPGPGKSRIDYPGVKRVQ